MLCIMLCIEQKFNTAQEAANIERFEVFPLESGNGAPTGNRTPVSSVKGTCPDR
jgi:hypothetical protein